MVRVLVDCFDATGPHLDRLLTLAEDADPNLASMALLWASHVYENVGNLDAARTAAMRALGLAQDANGPWLRAALFALVSGLAFQVGDLVEAEHYARAALPILRALGAHEDHAQAQANLAMLALHLRRFDEAERIFDELAAHDGTRVNFGGSIELMCGRAEMLLARGEVEAGLAAYADAVTVIGERGIPGGSASGAYTPWMLVTRAAQVAALVRHERRPASERNELLGQARVMLAGDTFFDVPTLGCALFALAVWELNFGYRDAGSMLLAYAERFAFNRMLPSLDWSWATALAQPAQIPGGDPLHLREAVLDVLTGLSPS